MWKIFRSFVAFLFENDVLMFSSQSSFPSLSSPPLVSFDEDHQDDERDVK